MGGILRLKQAFSAEVAAGSAQKTRQSKIYGALGFYQSERAIGVVPL